MVILLATLLCAQRGSRSRLMTTLISGPHDLRPVSVRFTTAFPLPRQRTSLAARAARTTRLWKPMFDEPTCNSLPGSTTT